MAASRRGSSWPPSGITKAMALRRSGLTSTAVTVIEALRRSGSRMSPRSSSSAKRWRSSSPTRSWRWPGARFSRSEARRRGIVRSSAGGAALQCRVFSWFMIAPLEWRAPSLEGRLDFLDVEAFDHVADLDVVVVVERHAALEAVLDFADLVLVALQRLQRAFVDHHVVAQQADLGAALDHAFGDHAAGDVADLGHAEDFANLRVAEEGLLVGRIEQADHQGLNVLGHLVDDAVVADIDLVALGDLARLRIGAHVEADDQRARRLGKRQVGLADAADAAIDHAGRHLLGAEPLQRAGQRFRRALHVRLDQHRKLLGRALADALDHLLEGAAAARGAGKLGLPVATGAEVGDLARTRLVLH